MERHIHPRLTHYSPHGYIYRFIGDPIRDKFHKAAIRKAKKLAEVNGSSFTGGRGVHGGHDRSALAIWLLGNPRKKLVTDNIIIRKVVEELWCGRYVLEQKR